MRPRAAQDFPVILDWLSDGSLTLTTVALLRTHLAEANHLVLLERARHQSKREVERQIASLEPKPDARSLIRRLPVPGDAAVPNRATAQEQSVHTASDLLEAAGRAESNEVGASRVAPARWYGGPEPTQPQPLVRPIAGDKYLLRVTLSSRSHTALRRAQDLMRHVVPNGDPAVIVEKALTLLVEELEGSKWQSREQNRALVRTSQDGHRGRNHHVTSPLL